MTSAIASSQSQTITSIAFGVVTTAIGIFTLWQGHKVCKMWRQQRSQSGVPLGSVSVVPVQLNSSTTDQGSDVEMGPAESTTVTAGNNHVYSSSTATGPISLEAWSFKSAGSHPSQDAESCTSLSPLDLAEHSPEAVAYARNDSNSPRPDIPIFNASLPATKLNGRSTSLSTRRSVSRGQFLDCRRLFMVDKKSRPSRGSPLPREHYAGTAYINMKRGSI